jgi:hypothetical protein
MLIGTGGLTFAPEKGEGVALGAGAGSLAGPGAGTGAGSDEDGAGAGPPGAERAGAPVGPVIGVEYTGGAGTPPRPIGPTPIVGVTV